VRRGEWPNLPAICWYECLTFIETRWEARESLMLCAAPWQVTWGAHPGDRNLAVGEGGR
jgi:hypothetical protein